MKTIVVEGKSLEDAYTKAEQELKTTQEHISFKVLEEKKVKLKKVIVVEASLIEDYPLKGLQYLKIVLEQLNINAIVEMRKKPDKEVQYVITSEENPILIGKSGKTLEALQILIRTVVNGDINDQDEQFRVSVDCGGYKKQRGKQLEVLATKTAKEVAQTKIEAHLEQMNSYERRVVHAKLADWRDVYTESEGEGKLRHVVIKPRVNK